MIVAWRISLFGIKIDGHGVNGGRGMKQEELTHLPIRMPETDTSCSDCIAMCASDNKTKIRLLKACMLEIE